MATLTSSSSNCFNSSRFRSYFSYYFTSSRRKLLLGASQILIFSFIFTLFFFYTSGESDYRFLLHPDPGLMGSSSNLAAFDPDFDPFWSYESGLMLVLSMLFMAFAGSWMFNALASGKKRLCEIEIPASQLEKFLTWWIIYLPLALLAMLVCFWLTDILRVIWIKLFTPYGSFAHLIPIKYILGLHRPYELNDGADIAGIIYGMIISINALFALGSILFHKLSFIKTVAFGFVLMAVLTIIYLVGLQTFHNGNSYDLTGRLDWQPSEVNLFFACAGAVFSLAVYWLCYARFKEEDLINRW